MSELGMERKTVNYTVLEALFLFHFLSKRRKISD
jgi:hypothetical protein